MFPFMLKVADGSFYVEWLDKVGILASSYTTSMFNYLTHK